MKKILFLIILTASVFTSLKTNAQCYNSTYGLWPSSTFTPNCNNAFANVTTSGYASEYSRVNLIAGNTYTFRSSVTTDYITVDNNGAAPLVGVTGVSGTGGVSWVCTATGTYRFYTHTSSSCGSSSSLRARSVKCSVASVVSTNCTNTTSFGSATINTNGTSVLISSCSYAGEYSTISGAVSGQSLRFTSSAAGDYITVRSGSPSGSVVAQGTTPLTFTNTFTGTLYVHWNLANSCGSQSTCRSTSVQCMSCTAPPAVSNDLCGGAISMSCGSTVTVNTTGATTDAAGSNFCGTTITTPGVWYRILGNGQNMTVSTVGLTSVDTKLMVFSGSCTGLTCLGGSDDFSGLQSQVSWSSVNGTSYFILAATFSGTGSFPMSLTCVAPYNACNSVFNIASCGINTNINIPSGNGLWSSFGGPFTTPGQEQIFTFTPTVTASYPITVTNNGSGWIDLFVKTTASGCNNSGWTYIDDISGTVTNNVTLTAGVTYYFLLDDEDSNGSTGSISLGCPCIGSSNDGTYTYSSAFSISGTTVGACDDSPLRSSFDRIYAVNISCAGSYTFATCGSSFDTYLYLTTAAGGGGTILAFNDDGCSLQSSLTASLNAGTYYIVVEGFSSTSAGAFTLNVSGTGSAPSISGSTTNASCNGLSNGTLSATVNGNGNTATATLNGNAFNGSATGLAAGTYTVVATNCWGSTTQTYTVDQPTALSASSTSGSIACNGGSTSVTVSATGGTAPYSGTGSFTVTAGTYNYTVTDANGCSSTTSITVGQPTVLSASSSSGTITCNGGSTTVTVSANGGTAPFSGTGSFTVTAGTYNYTVTDANGCTSNTSITVTEPTPLVATISSTAPNTTVCNGGTAPLTASVSGGLGTVNYQWQFQDNNGNWVNVSGWSATNVSTPFTNSRNASPSQTRAYRIVVTSSQNSQCTVTATQLVTVIPDPVFTFTSTNVTCNGLNNGTATAVLTGGLPLNYGYNWFSNDGISTNNNPSGDGTLTVTGLFPASWVINTTVSGSPNFGCYAQASVIITEPAVLVAASTSGSIACNGGSTTVTVSATGGTAPYSGTGSFTVTAGTYSYTVTDANGCTSTTSITVDQPSALSTSSSSGKIACNGGSTTVTVSATGGTAPYSGTGTFTVTAGIYNYSVTDANGCTSTTSITLLEPTLLIASNVASDFNGFGISCNGGSNGSITVSATGGTTPYSGDGANTGLSAGTYNYTVTDANGCIASTGATLTEPTQLVAANVASDFNGFGISCNGGSNGSITVFGNGGVAPYSGDGVNTGLSAGTFSYTVIDANGCSASTGATLTEPTQLIATNITSDFNGFGISCNGGSNGSITVSANGGVAPYSGDGANTGLSAGSYSYTVTDANGCSASTGAILTEPTLVEASVGPGQTVFYGYAPMACATISGYVTGGNPGYTYNWSSNGVSNGTSSSINVCPSQNTTYTFTATDTFGCSSSADVDICVVDVICYAGNGNIPKVEICQIPQGNPSNAHTICVSANAVPTHLANGCQLGACGELEAACGENEAKKMDVEVSASVLVAYPNPTANTTTVSVTLTKAGNYSVAIFDMMGKLIKTVYVGSFGDYENLELDVDMTNLDRGVYMIVLSNDNHIIENTRVIKN